MSLRGSPTGRSGFTLLEIMIVVTILAILVSIGVPSYQNALRSARIRKATQELRIISQAIDAYRMRNEMELPLTLYEVGHGGRKDPWGMPYCYLNYAAGSGDGLDWAVSVGLVDPSAVLGSGDASGASTGGTGNGNGKGNGNGNGNGNGGNSNSGIGSAISSATGSLSGPAIAALAHSLKANNAKLYLGVAVETTRRRDKFLFPLNKDYDLFSLGPNRHTAVSLSEALAQDDVLRANDGAFFGSASDY